MRQHPVLIRDLVFLREAFSLLSKAVHLFFWRANLRSTQIIIVMRKVRAKMEEQEKTVRDFDLEDLNEDVLKELIKAYVSEAKEKIVEEIDFSKAMDVFCEMQEFGIEPDSQLASEIIKKCNTADEVKKIISACYNCSLDEEAYFYVANFLSVQEFEEYIANCLRSCFTLKKSAYLYFLKRIQSADLLLKIFYHYCKQYPYDVENIALIITTIQRNIKKQTDQTAFESAKSYARPYMLANEVISNCFNGAKEYEIKELFKKKIASQDLYDVIQIILSVTCRRKVLDKIYPIIADNKVPIALKTKNTLISNVHRRHKKIPKHVNAILQLCTEDDSHSANDNNRGETFSFERFISSNTYFNNKIDSILKPEMEMIKNDIQSKAIGNEELFEKTGVLSGLQMKFPSAFRIRLFITKLLIKIYNEDNIDGIFDLNILYHLGELKGINRRQEVIVDMKPIEYIPILLCWGSTDDVMDRIEHIAENERRLVRYEINNINNADRPGYLFAKDIGALYQSACNLVPEKYQILVCLFTNSENEKEQFSEIRALFERFENLSVITIKGKAKILSFGEIMYDNL